MKCDICNEEFDPANLSSVLFHQHDDGIDPSGALGIKGRMVEKAFPESANVNCIRYNYENKIMQVEFKNFKKYNYFDVPIEIWNEATESISIGSFMNRKIKGYFRYEFTDKNLLDIK